MSDPTAFVFPGLPKLSLAWWGRLLGPLLAVAVFWLLALTDLSANARVTAGVATLMALWWMTEAVPLAVTALLPIALFPLLGVQEVKVVTAQYGNKYIFLFMGGFMLALAIEKADLHRRVALAILSYSGTRAEWIIAGFMLATAGLSMWISNTATTVMMLPIAASVVAMLTATGTPGETATPRESPASTDPTDAADATDATDAADAADAANSGADATDRIEASSGDASDPIQPTPSIAQQQRSLGICMMLGIAYASSLGGIATLVGTPPNAQVAGILADRGIQLEFGRWMLLGLPLGMTFLVITWLLLTRVLFNVRDIDLHGADVWLENQRRRLGPLRKAEFRVLLVFCFVAVAWLSQSWLKRWDWLADTLPLIPRLDDTVIAMLGAVLLFAVPVNIQRGEFLLDWATARKLPWGVLLIFGGGFALSGAVQSTQLHLWIGERFNSLAVLAPILIVLLITIAIIFLTELTSNTATAAAIVPILLPVEARLNLPPLTLVLPATFAASCAFMLPAATPPNAIVIGSGRVTVRDMVKAGFWLNLVAAVLVTTFCWLLGHLVLPR